MTDAPRRAPTIEETGSAPPAPRRRPSLIDGDLPPPDATPADAPDVDAGEADVPEGRAVSALMRGAAAGRRGGRLGALFLASLTGLLTLGLGLWFWNMVEALIAQNVWLGRAALLLVAVFCLSALGLALRELAGLARLGRIDDLRTRAEHARASRAPDAARGVLTGLDKLYRGRAELTEARAGLAAAGADVIDGDALIDLAERRLMAPLDALAEAEARRAARNVAAATAFIPVALVDVIAALAINMRMIRRIAEIYGGRAGWLGSWRLMCAIATHLVAAGAMAVGDDLIAPALGGGVLAKVSRRFGEGLVNGALTARIGVAAIEVCRPLPFHTQPRPGVGKLIEGAFRSFKSGN